MINNRTSLTLLRIALLLAYLATLFADCQPRKPGNVIRVDFKKAV